MIKIKNSKVYIDNTSNNEYYIVYNDNDVRLISKKANSLENVIKGLEKLAASSPSSFCEAVVEDTPYPKYD